jgi:hypothetical protein
MHGSYLGLPETEGAPPWRSHCQPGPTDLGLVAMGYSAVRVRRLADSQRNTIRRDDDREERRGRDSNPRYLSAQRFSRPPPSATRSPLQCDLDPCCPKPAPTAASRAGDLRPQGDSVPGAARQVPSSQQPRSCKPIGDADGLCHGPQVGIESTSASAKMQVPLGPSGRPGGVAHRGRVGWRPE